MTEQSANSPEPTRLTAGSAPASVVAPLPPAATAGTRTLGRHACPGCGGHVHSQNGVCPTCGENLQREPRQIRCARCSRHSSSDLVICPGCGRELRAAPPRLLTWGAPTLLVALLFLMIVTQWDGSNPLAGMQAGVIALAGDIGAGMEPEVVIVMTPMVDDSIPADPANLAPLDADSAALAASKVASNIATVVSSQTVSQPETAAVAIVLTASLTEATTEIALALQPPTATPTPSGIPSLGVGGVASDPTAAQAAEAIVVAEATATPLPTISPTSLPTASPTPLATATIQPAATSQPTPRPSPTATRESTPTWTPVSLTPSVRNAGGMAVALLPTATDVSAIDSAEVASIAASAPSSNEDNAEASVASIAAAPVAPTDIPSPTATPLPSPTPLAYEILAGDTLVTIAARYEISVEDLMAANNMRGDDVFVIQPGQLLIIPQETPAAEISALQDNPDIRLEAPGLAAPADQASVSCGNPGPLVWQRVQFVKDSDKYLLHLGFISGRNRDGDEMITWVLAQPQPATETTWQLDGALCSLASAAYGHQWRWWVEVVEERESELVSVSPPSPIWGFAWE